MRTSTPIVIHKGKGLRYEPMDANKCLIFAKRNKNTFFETTSFGITEQLTPKQLKEIV